MNIYFVSLYDVRSGLGIELTKHLPLYPPVLPTIGQFNILHAYCVLSHRTILISEESETKLYIAWRTVINKTCRPT